MEDFELVMSEENNFVYGAIKNCIFSGKTRTVKALQQKTKIKNSVVGKPSTSRSFPMATLVEELKPVVVVEFEVECRENL